MPNTSRINLNGLEQRVERSGDTYLSPYILPDARGAEYGLVDDQTVTVYDTIGQEISMEAEARVRFDSDECIWMLYLDPDTERMYPHRRPAYGKFLIMQGSEPIGETRISRGPSEPLVLGSFSPYPAYERIRPFFRRLFESNKEESKVLRRDLEAIGLSLRTFDGHIIPTPWIEIGDGSSVVSNGDQYYVLFPMPDEFFNEPSYWVEEDDNAQDGNTA